MRSHHHRRGIGLAACLLLLVTSAPALAVRAEAPLRLAYDLPLVQVEINGQGPYWFLIDTGATLPFVVSERLVEELGLETRHFEFRGESATGEVVATNRATRVETLDIGQMQLKEQQGLVADLSSFRECRVGGSFFDGILGIGLFHRWGMLLVLDYPARKLVVDTRARLDQPDRQDTLRMFELEEGQAIPQVEMRIGGREVSMYVDSGSSEGVKLRRRIAQRLQYRSKPRPGRKYSSASGRSRGSVGRIEGELEIGGHLLESPVIEVDTGRPIIGSEVLRHFRLTLDFGQKLIRLERDDDGPIRMLGERHSGIVWCAEGPDDYTLEVTTVDSNGPAAEAGLRRGDRVVRINGRTPDALLRFGTTHWQRWLKYLTEGERARFRVVRNDRKLDLAIPVADDLGARFALANPEWRQTVRDVIPETPAAEKGIQVGDRLIALDGEPIRIGADLLTRLRTDEAGHELRLTLSRDGETYKVTVPIVELVP